MSRPFPGRDFLFVTVLCIQDMEIETMIKNGSQMVCESLIREGVEVIFGLPGGAILPLYQTLPEYPQLRQRVGQQHRLA